MSKPTVGRLPESEKGLQDAIYDYLVLMGFLVVRINQGAARAENDKGEQRYIKFAYWQAKGYAPPLSKGAPDILVALSPNGVYWALEIKAPAKNGKPRELEQLLKMLRPEQQAFLYEVNERGGIGLVVDNFEMVASAYQKEQQYWITTRERAIMVGNVEQPNMQVLLNG